MPEMNHPEPPTAALPVRRPDGPIFANLAKAGQPRKNLRDMYLERVSFAYLDDEQNLKTLTPIIGHETLNDILELLERGEIG